MLDPAYGGGILTLLRELFPILTGWGAEPELLYLSASDSALAPRQLLRRFRWWDTHCKTNLGFPGLAIGHVPARFRSLAYLWPYPVIQRYINQFDMHIVVGGALRGVTLSLTRKRYLIWVPTLFVDEYEARAKVGDSHASSTLSSPALPFLLWQEKLALRRAALILATSQYAARRIMDTCPEVSNRVRVVPCPVENPETDASTPATSDSATQKADILCVGRLSDPRKNIGLLLRAFALVARERPDARLLLIGGTDGQVTTQQLAELGIQDRVLDLGRVSDSELLDHYRRAQVFVLPSRQEGLGIVVLEAMAHGLPVVSTPCGGPEDHVRDGQTGYLVPHDDPAAMAQAISKLLNDSVLHQRMSRNALEWARHTFSRPVVEAKFRQAFELVYPGVMARL